MRAKKAEPETVTTAQFVERHGITIKYERTERKDAASWGYGARHWKVALSIGKGKERRRVTTVFSQGSAHLGEPTAVDVLGCLALDASCYDNAVDILDFARDFGTNDEKETRWLYKACGDMSRKLRAFLGEVDYDFLLCKVERG